MQTLIQAFNMQNNKNSGLHQSIFIQKASILLSFNKMKISFVGSIVFFVMFSCSFSNKLHAQFPIKVNIQVLPPYSPFLNDYLGLKSKTVLTLTNTSGQDRNIYLKANLTNSQNFVAKTKDNYLPAAPILLKAGQMTSLLADENLGDSFKEENLDIDYGNYKLDDIIRDGVMPDGNYTLCVTVFDYNTQEQLSDEHMGCKSFLIRYLNAPKIFNCSENKKVFYQNPQNIPFTWSPVIGNIQGLQIVYDLYISKLNPNDNPQDIIESGIINNVPNTIKISGIPTNVYSFTGIDPILEQGQYAWAVKARVEGQIYPIENDGLSNVCTIDYTTAQINIDGEPQMNIQAGNMNIGPDCSCKAQLPNNLSDLQGNPLHFGSVIKSGNLLVSLTAISKTNKGYSGTGTVPLPIINSGMVKVNVSFNDINIQSSNNEYYQTSGLIHAVIQSEASFLPRFNPLDPGSMNLNPGQVQSLSTYFETYGKQLISEIKKYPSTIAYDLPIGLDEKVMNIAITNLTLAPEQSYFDAVTVLDFIDGNAKVALAGQGICVDQNSICKGGKLVLIEDFAVPAIGFKLKGGIDDNDATSITFDKEGFDNLHIVASYTFPDNSLIDVADHKAAKVTVRTDTKKGWNDWIGDVTFSTFYMSGFPDMTFGPDNQGTKMYYDHSDTRNPDAIPMPYNSVDPNDSPIRTDLMTWRGLYIPSISLHLPASLTNINGKQLEVKAEKLIFDEGLSGNISVNNIMSISDGSLDGWYYSIDQFKINIWKNTFKSSGMNGKLVLPVSKDYKDASNQLDYSCTLSKPTNSDLEYNFKIFPKDNIAFNVFWAKCKLIEGTNIQIIKTNNEKFMAKAVLFGKLAVQPQIGNFPNVNIVEIKFENIGFQSQAPYVTPGQANAAFFTMASPQHSIAGFSIDFDPTPGKGISLYTNNNNGFQMGLKFKAQLKLVKDVDFVPKADVEFNIYGDLKLDGNRPNWDGIGANISKIKLEAGAKIGPVGVNGELAYFNDNNGSYGFMGGLEMNVAEVVTVGAKAQFGYSANEGGFNYFFIDGMADFKGAGLPLGPCLAIYGFGGGVFYNMAIPEVKLDGSNIKASPNYVFDNNNLQAGVSLSGIVYTPKKGLFSVKAAVLFGLTNRNVLDADGSVTMSFNAATGGVKDIMFEATGRFISNSDATLTERNKNCMGKLVIIMQMNFDEKSFLFHADVEAGVPTHQDKDLFYVAANLNFYGGPSGWFVHVGRPWKDGNFNGGSPIEITVLKSLTFRGYFQCGNGSGKVWDKGNIISGVNAVDPMPPIPNYILGIINNNNRKGENGSITNSATDFNNLGSPDIKGGLAFGANFSTHLDASFLIFYLNAQFMAGFDLGFYELTADAKCINEQGQIMQKGVNGFYATGQAYLGASIDVGIDIDLFFFSGKISIVSAGAAAYVKFGGPEPTYASGALGGQFSVLGGLISGSFAVKFYWGQKCYVPTDESIDLISEVNPSGEFDKKNYSKPVSNSVLQPVDLQPYVNFNFEIDKTFLIIANVSDNNPDDPSATYRQYRYYHILPSDITIKISGGQIFQNGSILSKPLNSSDFKVSNDHFTVLLKEPIMLHSDQNFNFDVAATVKIFNLREQSKTQANTKQGYKDDNELSGVTNTNRNQWDDAKTKDGKIFVDERHVKFTTDCGIKTINEEWITNIEPLHRSQNNPTGFSPAFNQNQLREGSHFTPVYNISKSKDNLIKLVTKTNNTVASSYYLGKNELKLSLSNGYLGEYFICIPPEFKNNFEYKLKVSSFGKTNSGNSFTTKFINAQISSDNRTISAKMDSDFPKESFVVVQVILKKIKSANAILNNDLSSKFIVKKEIVDQSANVKTQILARSVNLESKLSAKNDEMELFRWYFTTGSYSTYRDKMADLNITRDTATVTAKAFSFNKSGIQEASFKVLASTYKFMGQEKFDFHDLHDYYLNQVFDGNDSKNSFSKKLADGYLGFAFDKVSQDVVDGFLRTYFDNPEVKFKWYSYASNATEASAQDETTIKGMLLNGMNSYITDKMFDATKWDDVTEFGKILPPLNQLPTDLFYKSDFLAGFQFSMLNTKPDVLFTVKRLSKVIKYDGNSTKIIPSHIINMKNLLDNLPGNGPVILQSYLADAMQNFNNTIMPNVSQGFNPSFINNKSNFKK